MSTQDSKDTDEDGDSSVDGDDRRDDRDPTNLDIGDDDDFGGEFDSDPETTEVNDEEAETDTDTLEPPETESTPNTPTESPTAQSGSEPAGEHDRSETTAGTADSDSASGGSGGGYANLDDIPHRIRADSPQDGRESITLFVSDEDKRRLQELQQLAGQKYEKRAYKIDVYLAALRGGLDSDDRFLREMQEIGYGLGD